MLIPESLEIRFSFAIRNNLGSVRLFFHDTFDLYLVNFKFEGANDAINT